MAHQAVLYTRDGCCLCQRAKEVLRRLQPEFDLEIREVDIGRDPALSEQYGTIIPVVVIDGRHRFESRIAEHYLRRVLTSAAQSGRSWPWQR